MTGQESASAAKSLAAYVVAWVLSWKLGDVQLLAGTFSAFAIGGVAVLNGYVVWRDKIASRKPRAHRTVSGDL